MVKIMFVSDMHGRSPAEEIKRHPVQRLVALGDFDTPGVVSEIRDLPIKVDFVIGNHEYHYLNGAEISSPCMSHDFGYYNRLWHSPKNDSERRLFEEAIRRNELTFNEKVGEEQFVYAHAGIINSGQYPPGFLPILWTRMFNPDAWIFLDEVVRRTFRVMSYEHQTVLFRGHDHYSSLLSTSKKSQFTNPKFPIRFLRNIEGPRELERDMMHIITVGAFFDQEYAIYDTRKREIEFRVAG
jgi:hypothetical protein